MAEILARCGYRCDLCPGYVGNIQSIEDKQRVSDGWFKIKQVLTEPSSLKRLTASLKLC